MKDRFLAMIGKKYAPIALGLTLLASGGVTETAWGNARESANSQPGFVVQEVGSHAYQNGADSQSLEPSLIAETSDTMLMGDFGVTIQAQKQVAQLANNDEVADNSVKSSTVEQSAEQENSSANNSISNSVVQILSDSLKSDKIINLTCQLINEKLQSYGLSLDSFPNGVLEKYLDATQDYLKEIMDFVATKATQLESQGVAQTQVESFINEVIPQVLPHYADAVIKAMVDAGEIKPSHEQNTEDTDLKSGGSVDCINRSDAELLAELEAKYGDMQLSKRIDAAVQQMSKLDCYRLVMFKKINDGLQRYGLTWDDITSELRKEAMLAAATPFKRNYVEMCIEGTKMEDKQSSDQDIVKYLDGAMRNAMSSWGEAIVHWLVNSGNIDSIIRQKQQQ